MDKSQLVNFEAAMQEFIARTKPQQLAVLVNMVSMGEAEEILQEAYLKIYLLVSKNPNQERPLEQLMSLLPMLYSIAKNLAISNLRHQKVVNLHIQKSGSALLDSEALQTQGSEYELIKQDQEALILSAINQLPPICRQVFVQRKLHSKSHADIAAMLGISTKTVESHLAKGLTLCREYVRKAKQADNKQLRANSL
ncbi:sigma-70 family RNA polymerase sigma factor [uncultured Paraglaciecola sp.]|uniref:RNA polymerase sigma factor n=1 Tax=uncultured Paraglaciecola sp. TaxID=1765024 RepID=UPI0030D6E12A